MIAIGQAYILYALLTLIIQPHKINLLYGYRSKLARSDQKIWEDANIKFTSITLRYGIGMLLLGLFQRRLFEDGFSIFKDSLMKNIMMAILLIIIPLIINELYLRQKYN